MDLEETFLKIRTIIDFCYGENNFTIDDILSMWMSNFTGEEIIEFRKNQAKQANKQNKQDK